MAVIAPYARLDGFTWHGYPLGAGKDPKVDQEIMNPDFNEKVKSTGDKIQQDAVFFNMVWTSVQKFHR